MGVVNLLDLDDPYGPLDTSLHLRPFLKRSYPGSGTPHKRWERWVAIVRGWLRRTVHAGVQKGANRVLSTSVGAAGGARDELVPVG